jgi:hypothetical protein
VATATLAARTNTKNRLHLGELPWRNNGGSPFRSFTPNIAVSYSEGEAPDLAVVGGLGARSEALRSPEQAHRIAAFEMITQKLR